jgi:cytochrome P450 family 2 subfamily U polypeptide 1
MISERQLLGITADLFGAGTETTTTTLMWSILYMCLNQQIQNRVHAEIDDVIGPGVVPTTRLRSQMPYTEACISEIQRISDIVPLGVPRGTTIDVNLKGYYIPEGTMVMANMHSVHWDSKLWPEPEKFKPERFLDAAGKIVRREELIPFSIGKKHSISTHYQQV